MTLTWPSDITEALKSLCLETSGSRRERCSRLRKGVQLHKGWTSRDSDRTSVTSVIKDNADIELDNFAAGLIKEKQTRSLSDAVTVSVTTMATNATTTTTINAIISTTKNSFVVTTK